MQPYRQGELFHFKYNMDTKVVEQEERLAKTYGLKKLYENMPYDFAEENVHEEDKEAYIDIYRKLDEGEKFATCDFRVKGSDVWLRVCIYRENMDSPIVNGVVQDVSTHYDYIVAQAEEREKEAERRIGLEFEAAQLMRAVNDAYDMFFMVNLSQNNYKMINYENFINHGMELGGVFDELITFGVNNVPDEYKESFYNHFSREALLKAYAQGKKDVYLEHLHYGDDGKAYWIYTHVLFVENPNNNDIMEITLCQNIEERVRKDAEYKEKLKEAARAAEAANNAKSDFLSRMSHDIRTPMNAIQGFIQILKKNIQNEEMAFDIIDKIERSSDTLGKLLGDVLELSRIESGKEEINTSIVDLNTHLEKFKAMFESELNDNQVEFVMESNVQNPRVWVDELKLTQICMNMISNAKKFTPSGGRIIAGIYETSSYKPEYATYRFYVKDTGIGMSDEFQKKAFGQFEREYTYTSNGATGSGLGMSIIKKLVELMGGTCELKSKLGEGTEIAGTLELQIATDVGEEKESRELLDIDFSGRRVLLVEDNDFNREIAYFVLENMGFAVEDAEDGSVAVNKLLNAPDDYFDLVLMDIQMPIMDGYTATREIRRIERASIASIPIIAMTANAFQEDKNKCMEVGMNGHIAKPVDARELVKEIEDALQNRISR